LRLPWYWLGWSDEAVMRRWLMDPAKRWSGTPIARE